MTARTPTLSPEQRARVRALLSHAVELDAEDRSGFIQEAATDDDAVRDEAISLLIVADELDDGLTGSGDLLESVRAQAALGVTGFEPGRRVGRYTIIEEIGRGGFAVVYLAEQRRPITRRVALKVLSLGIESEAAADRFRLERQVLASLDHPGIASIYDAGTTRCGRLYFAMELVRGPSVTRHCDHRRLSIRERLTLFARICDAVHYAHQRGVIHRDLKPSNILVPSDDPDPVPRVIDFGIAKVIGPDAAADATVGGRALGTPDYMSPEQFRGGGESADTRTDVYSLGVLLFELLTGVLPVERFSGSEPAVAEPVSPSRRMRSRDLDMGPIANARATDAQTLRQQLRGELSWILARALRRDREERYTSVAAMGEDIRAYLERRPLSVGPESALYRARKFVARHRWPVAGACAAVLALVAGVIGTGTAAAIANRNAREASLARDAANAESYAARVSLLGHALGTGNRTLAVAMRDELDPDLGDWERRYIDARLSAWIWSVNPDATAVGALAASPDGTKIALLTQSGNLHLLDAGDGSILRTRHLFPEAEGWWRAPAGLAADSSGHSLIAADGAGQVLVLDLLSLETLRTWTLESGVYRAEYSDALGAFLLLLHDGRLLRADPNDETPLELARVEPGYQDLALADGGRIASLVAGRPPELVIIDLIAGTRIETAGKYAGSIAGALDGDIIVAAHHDRERDTLGADMIDGKTGEVIRRLSSSENITGELDLTRDGRLGVFTPSYSPLIGAIDLTRDGVVHTVGAHDGNYVTRVECVPGGVAVSGDSEGGVRLWDPARAEGSAFLRFENAFLSDVTTDPSGRLLVVCGAEVNRVVLVDVDEVCQIGEWDLSESPGYVSSVGFNSDATLAYVLYSRGRAEVRSAPGGELVATLSDADRASTSYTLRGEFSADGRWLAIPDTTGRVRIWSVPGFELAGEVAIPDASVHQVAFSPNSETIVAAWKGAEGEGRGGVMVWDLGSLRELRRFELGVGTSAVAFDPGGHRVVAGGLNGEVCVCDLDSGRRTSFVGMGTERVATVAFTPDGKRVLATGHIRSILVWDADTGLSLLTIPGPSVGYHTNDLDIGPKGTLITCGGNVVQIHRVE